METKTTNSSKAEANQSVEHAFAVLKLFATTPEPLGVVDISRRLDLSLGTCHRVLITLCASGFARQLHEGGKYVPGVRVRELLLTLYGRFPIRDAAGPILESLTSGSGLACSLSVPLGDTALRITGVPDRLLLHRPLQLGLLTDLHAGATALAILAFLPEERRLSYVGRQVADQREPLAAQLGAIRDAGHVSSVDETLRTVAIPVLDGSGHAVAAIALEGAPAHFPSPTGRQVGKWKATISRLEKHLVSSPALARGPFDHLPLEQIGLRANSQVPLVEVQSLTQYAGRSRLLGDKG